MRCPATRQRRSPDRATTSRPITALHRGSRSCGASGCCAGTVSGLPCFDAFTFDHVLTGLAVGCRRDTKELFGIRVESNAVSREILRPAGTRFADREAVAYEAYGDAERSTRVRARPALPAVLPD